MNKIFLGLLGSFLISNLAFAEDRALIMGLNIYKNPKYNLPGVDMDVKVMENTAHLMGFNAIKVLQNEQITKDNLEATVQSWLVNGVSSQDRVLIYFSGHGSTVPDENGDETDGQDEVLTTHLTDVVKKRNGTTLEGVVTDDDFGLLLSKIPSNNILVMLDSCHSGTATRSLNKKMVSKALIYEGMPKPLKKTRSLSKKPREQKRNIVTIGAANDNEESLSTFEGGLFTLGFNKIIKKAIAEKKSLTPLEIKQKVDDYIQKQVDTAEYKTFHPQVSGDESLLNTKFLLVGVNNPSKPQTKPTPVAVTSTTALVTTPEVSQTPSTLVPTTVWGDLENLVQKTAPLNFVTNKTTLIDGDDLTLRINAMQQGYLYILTVDATNSATLLFPNLNHLDNAVSAGEFTFPTLKSGFKLTTQAPFGKSLVVALISQEKIDLYAADKDAKSQLLKNLSRDDIKNLFHTAINAGKVEILSCQSAVTCQ